MTRNWKWSVLTTAALVTAGGTASAQECRCAVARRPAQVNYSAENPASSDQTLWECLFGPPVAPHARCNEAARIAFLKAAWARYRAEHQGAEECEVLPDIVRIGMDNCRFVVSGAGIEGRADRRVAGADGQVFLLEGNVELLIRRPNHPARIVTERAIVNLCDGTYEVMPCHVEDTTWIGRVKPMPAVVPTPAERGWR